MGNCLVLQDKAIKIVRTDGKVLEYQAPMKVDEILREFSGHVLSDSFSHPHHLQPDTKLLSGQFYYLLPTPLPSPKVQKKDKKVRFANPEVADTISRVKVLISKQELQRLLQEGSTSVQDVVSRTMEEQSLNHASDEDLDSSLR